MLAGRSVSPISSWKIGGGLTNINYKLEYEVETTPINTTSIVVISLQKFTKSYFRSGRLFRAIAPQFVVIPGQSDIPIHISIKSTDSE